MVMISLKNLIKNTYSNVANSSKECVCDQSCDTENKALKIGYSSAEIAEIPIDANLGLSCGNPLAFSCLSEGETVLDLGSGAGFDSFLAASKVKSSGKVIGVDFSQAMVDKANLIAKQRNILNTEFICADIEELPIKNETIDIVISNCVLNLISNKSKVYNEVYRTLKNGGRMYISDVALLKTIPNGLKSKLENQSACLQSNITVKEYEQLLLKAGFKNIKINFQKITSCFTEDSNDPFGVTIGKLFKQASLNVDDFIVSIKIEAFKN